MRRRIIAGFLSALLLFDVFSSSVTAAEKTQLNTELNTETNAIAEITETAAQGDNMAALQKLYESGEFYDIYPKLSLGLSTEERYVLSMYAKYAFIMSADMENVKQDDVEKLVSYAEIYSGIVEAYTANPVTEDEKIKELDSEILPVITADMDTKEEITDFSSCNTYLAENSKWDVKTIMEYLDSFLDADADRVKLTKEFRNFLYAVYGFDDPEEDSPVKEQEKEETPSPEKNEKNPSSEKTEDVQAEDQTEKPETQEKSEEKVEESKPLVIKEFKKFTTETYVLDEKGTFKELLDILPKQIDVVLEDGTGKRIDVTWAVEDGDDYDNTDYPLYFLDPVWDEKEYTTKISSWNIPFLQVNVPEAPKVSEFPDKTGHHVFVETAGKGTVEVNGRTDNLVFDLDEALSVKPVPEKGYEVKSILFFQTDGTPILPYLDEEGYRLRMDKYVGNLTVMVEFVKGNSKKLPVLWSATGEDVDADAIAPLYDPNSASPFALASSLNGSVTLTDGRSSWSAGSPFNLKYKNISTSTGKCIDSGAPAPKENKSYNFTGKLNSAKTGYTCTIARYTSSSKSDFASLDQPHMKGSGPYLSQGISFTLPASMIVRYNANGGTGVDNTGGYTLNSSGGVLKDGSVSQFTWTYGKATLNLLNRGTVGYTKKGYHIDGATAWRIGSTSGTTITDADTTTIDNGAAERKKLDTYCESHIGDIITLYQNWLANKGVVRYNANGGTNPVNDAGYTLNADGLVYQNSAVMEQNFTYGGTKINLYDRPTFGYTKTGYHVNAETAWRINSPTGPTISCISSDTSTPEGTAVVNQMMAYITDKNNVTLTMYQNWLPNTYTVKYDGNGATGGSTASSSHTYDTAKNLTANGFTRTNYVFNGWNTKADGTGTSYANSASVTNLTSTDGGIVTLYAQWKLNGYTVTYKANGAVGSDQTQSITQGTAWTTKGSSTFARTGYTLSSWNTKADGSGTKYSVSTAQSTYSNLTLYAQWTPITYTVEYHGSGHTGGSTASSTHTYGVAKALTKNGFTKTGYHFTGWAALVSGNAVYSDGESVINLASKNGITITLYATWAPNTYTVKYDGNGSTSGSTANSSHTYDAAKALTANGYSRTGYTFQGWNTKADGTGTSYTDKESVKNLTSTNGGTVTLYAKWKANTYTVTYKANGGTGTDQTQGITHGTAWTTKGSSTFTRTGYTLSSWNTAANGSGTKYSVSTAQSTYSNLTLYAQWTPITYTVKYDGNGSTGGSTASSSHTYGTAKALTANGFTKTGYHFAGWATSASGNVAYSNSQSVTNLSSTSGATVTLYAKWTANTYTVTYNGNGNTGGSTANSTHTYGTAKNLTANGFTKTGYSFKNWNTKADGSGTSYANSASVSNLTSTNGGTVTLYAQWTINTYTNTIAHWAGGFTKEEGNNSAKTMFNLQNTTFTAAYNSSYVLNTDRAVTIPRGFYLAGSYGTSAVTGTWTNYTMGTSVTQKPNGMSFQYSYYPNTYNITYSMDGGTNSSANPATYNVLYGVTLSNPTRTGYTFAGWYNGTTKVTGINPGANATFTSAADMYDKLSTRTIGNITLTAKWTPNTYTVAYNGNGNTGGSTASAGHTYDTAKALTANGFTKTGYSFNGWNTKADGTGTAYADKASVKNLTSTNGGTVTLYAQWKINQYTLTINPNGGAYNGATGNKTVTQNYLTTYALLNPTRTGYIFNNWLLSGSGSLGNVKTTDPTFKTGSGNVSVYNNTGNGMVVHTRQAAQADNPTDSAYEIKIQVNGTASPGNGGFYQSVTSAAGKTYIHSFIAKIPAGYTVNQHQNATGTGSTVKWLTPHVGTGKWETYAYELKAGTTGTFSTFGHVALSGGTAPFTWYLASSQIMTVESSSTYTYGAGNGTVTAQWTPIMYTVAYNGNGNTGGSTANSSHIYDVSKDLTANGFSKTGYTFKGWNTKADGTGTTYANSASVKNLTSTNGATVTLYAQWTPNTYTVKYDNNGGTGAPASHTVTYDSTAAISKTRPTRTGYTFVQWSTKSSGDDGFNWTDWSGTWKYVNGQYGIASGSLQLYAIWKPNTYTVKYDNNGGTGAPASHTVTYDSTAAISKTRPTRTGYTFVQWSTKSSGDDGFNWTDWSGTWKYVNGQYGIANDTLTLYAVWKPNTYTVKYDKNATDATGTTANSSHTYDVAKALTANGYSRTGYTFSGWSTKADGTGTKYADKESVKNLTATSGGTVTLYAQWKANGYTVTYNSNKPAGASATVSGTTANSDHTYDTAKALTANGYTLTGWTFQNWNTKADGTGTAYADKASVKNLTATNGGTVTLYAQWKANTYTVTYNKNATDATGTTANSSHTYDVAKALTANGYSRTGYTFTGWNTKADGSGTAYTDKVSVKNLASANGATVTLYAQWKINTYTDTIYHWACGFKYQEGNNGEKNDFRIGTTTFTADYNSSYVMDEARAIKIPNGYYLDKRIGTPSVAESWSQIAMGDTVIQKAGTMWYEYYYYPTYYPITYQLDGGTQNAANPASYGVLYGVSLKDPTRTGYTFAGWYDNANILPSKFTTALGTQNGTTYTFANTVSGNKFSSAKIQIWDANDKYLVQPSYTATIGTHSDTYTHTYDSGYYKIRFGANGDLADCTNITVPVYLEKGKKYTISYTLSEFSSSKVVMKDITVKRADSVTGINEGKNATFSSPDDMYAQLAVRQTGNMTLTAKWTPNTYTVKYDGNTADGGSTADSSHVYHSELHTGTKEYYAQYEFMQTGHDLAPVIDKYGIGKYFISFDLYSDKPGDMLVYMQNGSSAKYSMMQHFDSTTSWKHYSFILNVVNWTASDTKSMLAFYGVYDTGNNPHVKNIVFAKCDESLTANGYTKTGHTFTGWNTKADGTGNTYTDKAPVKNLSTGEPVTLHAQWKPNVYTITYNLDGGTNHASNPASYIYGKGVEKLYDPSRTGYKFMGWYRDAAFTKPVSSITATDLGNITLYAKWDQFPEITVENKSVYEGQTVTTADLLKNIKASDKEDGDISKKLKVVEIQYAAGKIVDGKSSPAYTVKNPSALDTWFLQMPEGSVKHTVKYEVTDSVGNTVTKAAIIEVKYNSFPEIEAEDRYFTLEEANALTADKLIHDAKSTDKEEGNLTVTALDFHPEEFEAFTDSGYRTVTFHAQDSYGPGGKGKEVTKQITVFVVKDGVIPEEEKTQMIRSIGEKYYNLNAGLSRSQYASHEDNGGLYPESKWYTDPEYRELIESTWRKTSGTTYTFTPEKVDEIKEYIDTNGIGNVQSDDSLREFANRFL